MIENETRCKDCKLYFKSCERKINEMFKYPGGKNVIVKTPKKMGFKMCYAEKCFVIKIKKIILPNYTKTIENKKLRTCGQVQLNKNKNSDCIYYDPKVGV